MSKSDDQSKPPEARSGGSDPASQAAPTGGRQIPPGLGDALVLGEALSSTQDMFRRRSSSELAEIVHDSLIDDGQSASDHHLVFEHTALVIHVQVCRLGDGSDLIGMLTPPCDADVDVLLASGAVHESTRAKEGGFSFSGVPHRVIRLAVGASDGVPPIGTDWFRV